MYIYIYIYYIHIYIYICMFVCVPCWFKKGSVTTKIRFCFPGRLGQMDVIPSNWCEVGFELMSNGAASVASSGVLVRFSQGGPEE